MAGPRAPIGTLSQHAATAAGLVRKMVPKAFTRTDPKGTRKTEKPVESDSDSDSESESGSGSDSDSDSAETDQATRDSTKNWADSLKAKKAASTPIKAETSPAMPPKAKTASPATKVNIKKSESATSESEGESESDSGSDDEDAKMDVDMKEDAKKNIKEESSDSEAESEASDEEMADAKPIKEASSTSASEDGSGSESESSDEESVAGKSAAKPATKASAAAESSASDEESASESESEDEEQPAAKAKSTAQEESESESESEDEPEPPRKTKEKASTQTSKPAKETASAKSAPVKPPKPAAPVNGARSKEFVSESESSSDAEGSESESESEDDARSLSVEKQKEKATVRAPPREIVSQGFTLRKAEEDLDAAKVARAFKKAKAEGKQIWYFTTPKSVPIEVIQKQAIPLDKVAAGKPILSHDGAEYTGHFEEVINHAIKVLIPGQSGSKYETLNQSVDRVLHITRVTRFAEEDEREPAPPSTSAVISNAPRPQPKALKARYQPFGVTNGAPGKSMGDASDSDGDVEMTQAPPLPNGSAKDAKSDSSKKAAKKRKHGDVETPSHEEPAATPAKKPKKARVDSKAVEPSPAPVKQTPIAPPPIPTSSTKAAAPSKPASSSAKKSKGKDKSKKKDSASTEKTNEVKPPPKVTPVPPPAVPNVKSS